MEKSKLLQVIAAIMITSMAISMLSFSTTSVVSAYTAPTIGLTPIKCRDNGWVLFTLTVNNTAGTDNVENIIILDIGAGFNSPLGGTENVKENWDNLGDNLISAFSTTETGYHAGDHRNWTMVRDNLLEAVVNIKAAGTAFQSAATYENYAAAKMWLCDNDNQRNAAAQLDDAPQYWYNVGALFSAEPFNLYQIAENIKLAYLAETNAASYFINERGAVLTGENALARAGENMDNAARRENLAAENLRLGSISHFAENLEIAGRYWQSAANTNLRGDWAASGGATQVTLYDEIGANIDNFGRQLALAAENLQRAAENIREAGLALGSIDNRNLDNARIILARDTRNTRYADFGSLKENENILPTLLVENIRLAAASLASANPDLENDDNLFNAGENLKAAVNADSMGLSATYQGFRWLGPLLGGDILGYYGEPATVTNSVRYYLYQAGDNLDNVYGINITNAANALYNAGSRLADLGTKIKSTATTLWPDSTAYTMGLENGGMAGTNGLLFNALIQAPYERTDNQIAVGATKVLRWLWRAPDIATQTNYTINIRTIKPDNSKSPPSDILVTVDGQAPYLVSMAVTQAGVSGQNAVGKVKDNGNVTLTVVASEELSAIGQAYIENVGSSANGAGSTNENVIVPLTLTNPSADLKTWTTTFNVTTWLDNWENLRVNIRGPWATDNFALENSDSTVGFLANIDNLMFDVRPPFFNENGLNMFNRMKTCMKPGTTTMYRENTRLVWDNIIVNAEDNTSVQTASVRRGWVTATVYVNDSPITMYRDSTDNTYYTTSTTLVEGVNTIRVVAVDRVGNSSENKIENIFIDNTKPIQPTLKISKIVDGVEQMVDCPTTGITTNDNSPHFLLTIKDAGWGIPRDNVRVFLDNDTDIHGGYMMADNNLENKGVWDNGASDWNFENYCHVDNGIPNGTYYLRVFVSDNVFSTSPSSDPSVPVRENDNYAFKFVIDVTTPTWTQTQLQAAVTVKDSATSALLGATTKKTSWLIAGGARKPSSTINVYVSASAPVLKGTATSSATLNANTLLYDYSLTIEFSEGAGQSVYIEEIDNASNSSGLVLLGTYTVDATPPVIALSAPAAGTTTDAAQITVSGTIVDAIVTDPQILIVTIDCTGASVAKTVYLNADGSFETTVPLVEGANVINVVAMDAAVTATSGNQAVTTRTVTRTVTPLTTYAIILVVVALILAAIAIFRKEMK